MATTSEVNCRQKLSMPRLNRPPQGVSSVTDALDALLQDVFSLYSLTWKSSFRTGGRSALTPELP
jgi:hypothetical protein